MPVITSIKPQKNGKRVNVYVDDKFGFGLDLENYVSLGLKVEQELTDQEISEIIKKAEFQKTLDKLLRFATLRPRSEKEVCGWFRKKQVPQSLQQELVNKLVHFELFNDEKFAKWWVEQRLGFRPKPKSILFQELRIKGIAKDIIDEVLANTEVDEEKMASTLLAKKAYKWKNINQTEAKRKMSEFLARHGFGWETIKAAIDGYFEKE